MRTLLAILKYPEATIVSIGTAWIGCGDFIKSVLSFGKIGEPNNTSKSRQIPRRIFQGKGVTLFASEPFDKQD